jgi:type IV secretory pathway protease TraF
MNTQATAHGPFERDDHGQGWWRVKERKHGRQRGPRALRRINGFILLLILLLTLFLILGMACNKSPSAPIGLYRLIVAPPERGEYVALAMPLKLIAGMPGDWITTTPIGTYINGRLIPNSAPLTSHHWPYETFELGPTELWVVGRDPRSYDSRYLGPVPISLINAIAEPIWIEQ